MSNKTAEEIAIDERFKKIESFISGIESFMLEMTNESANESEMVTNTLVAIRVYADGILENLDPYNMTNIQRAKEKAETIKRLVDKCMAMLR